jgi:hypothetical protein
MAPAAMRVHRARVREDHAKRHVIVRDLVDVAREQGLTASQGSQDDEEAAAFSGEGGAGAGAGSDGSRGSCSDGDSDMYMHSGSDDSGRGWNVGGGDGRPAKRRRKEVCALAMHSRNSSKR